MAAGMWWPAISEQARAAWRWLLEHPQDVAIPLGLFCFTMWVRLAATLCYSIEVGLDGAYYTINVVTLLSGGYLYYDAPIVSFAVAALFTLLLGDVVVGVKVASALFGGLLNVGAYFAGRSFSRGDWRAGLVAGALCAVDVSQFQAVTSLVKNEAALAFLPFALAFFYRYVACGRRRVDLAGFLATGTLATLSHLMTAALLFAALIVYAGYEVLIRLLQRNWREALTGVAAPLVAGGCILLGVYVACDLFIPAADTWYTSSSLEKASGYSTSFDWAGGVISLLRFLRLEGPLPPNPLMWDLWMHLGVAAFIVVGVAVCLARSRPGDRAALSLLFSDILIGLVMGSWAFRLRAMYFVPAYLVLSLGLVAVADWASHGLSRVWQAASSQRSRRILSLLLVLAVLGGCLCVGAPRLAWTATSRIRPRASPQDLASIEAMQGMFPSNAKFYAPHGIEYFITSRTWYEAQPESGDSAWPVLCAQKMYWDIVEKERPSYWVITGASPFLQAFLPPENQLVRLISPGCFELFEGELNITVLAKQPLHSIQCILRSPTDPNPVTLTLTPIGGDLWTGTMDTSSLPEGICELTIIPLTVGPSLSPPPPPPPPENVLRIGLYRFQRLGNPHIPLSSLLYLAATPGVYQVYTVNTTTAQAIDLLNRDVSPPSIPHPTQTQVYMLLLTPLFYLPFLGDLSTFIILLILCPLTGIYWLGAGTLLAWFLRQLAIRFHPRLSRFWTSHSASKSHTTGRSAPGE